jgi:Aspartyl protease
MPAVPPYRISDTRLKLAGEYFLGGRLAAAHAVARALWHEGERTPALAVLYGELLLLANRLESAEPALRLALEDRPGQPRVIGLLAELARRAGRFGEAAERFAVLGRAAKAARLAELARTGAYLLPGGSGRVKLDWIDRRPLPCVAAQVGGVALNLLLDTGVGDTLLDADLAERLDVRTFGSEPIQFPSGPAGRVALGILPELRLGTLAIGQVPVQVMPLRDTFAHLSDRPVDGILGTGLFSRFRTTLDYARGCLTLARDDDRLARGEPFYLGGEHYPLVEARINARLDALLFLDTGWSARHSDCRSVWPRSPGSRRFPARRPPDPVSAARLPPSRSKPRRSLLRGRGGTICSVC